MAYAEEQEQQPLAAAPPGGGGGGTDMRHIKLSDFWPHAPQLWFSQTECRFAAQGINNEFARYCLVVGALPHDSLRGLLTLSRCRRRTRPTPPSSSGFWEPIK
jgi:hypothetical protein